MASPEHRPHSNERLEHIAASTEAREAMDRLEAARERPEVLEDKQERIEQARQHIEQQPEVHARQAEQTHEPRTISGLDRVLNYRQTMRSVQQRLRPASRAFSKFIHNAPVERASEVLEVTVMRPSVTLGATMTALVVGGVFFFTAHKYGFRLSGSEFVVSLAVGAILGALIELAWNLARRFIKR